MAADTTGQTIFVTGAGSGIGRATALRFAQAGASVACADLVGEAASETASLAGDASCAIEVDVRHEESVQSAFREADHRLGSDLHVLVNVAGVGSTTPVPTTAAAVWDDVQAVNARGTFLCCREAIPRLTKTGGSIVNVASVAGLVGLRNRAAYCASKGAVIALTRAMAVDHVEDGVRVNCVCPGTIDSPWVRRLLDQAGESLDALRARQPMGRLGTPEEVADAICYLASRRAAFVTGSAFVIDGGLTAAWSGSMAFIGSAVQRLFQEHLHGVLRAVAVDLNKGGPNA